MGLFDNEVFQTRSADLDNLKLRICEEKVAVSPVMSVECNWLWTEFISVSVYQYISLSVYQFISVSVCQCISLSVYHFIRVSVHQFISLSVYQFISVSVYQCISLSVYHFISVSVYQCISLSVYQFISVSFYQCISLSVYQCIGLSVYQFISVSVVMNDIWRLFLGAFTKLREATVSFAMSIRPSARNDSAPTGRIFMKFDIWVYFEKLSRIFKIHSSRTGIKGAFHGRPIHVFLSYRAQFFLERIRLAMYVVTLRRVRTTIVVVEKP